MNNGFLIAEVIFRHVFCRKTAKNGVMIVLLMRQDNILYFQLFNCRINNKLFPKIKIAKACSLFGNYRLNIRYSSSIFVSLKIPLFG